MENVKLRHVDWMGIRAIVVGKRKNGTILLLTESNEIVVGVEESEVTFL